PLGQEAFMMPPFDPFNRQTYNTPDATSIQSESSPRTTLMQPPPYIEDFLSPSNATQFSPLAISMYHTSYSQNFPEAFSRSTRQSQITDNVEIVPSQVGGGDGHEEGRNEGW